MSVSSPDKQMEWNDDGVEGSFRFINKLVRASENTKNKKADEKTDSKYRKYFQSNFSKEKSSEGK